MASNEVRIVVTAEDNASKPIERISTATVASGVAIGTVFAKMAEKALSMGRDMVMSFSEVGSQFFDLSAKTGMSVESLSALKFAAEQSGTSLDAIAIAAKKMNTSIFELGNGTTEVKETFAALSLSLADLQGKGVDESFAMITSRLADLGDKSTQSALAVKLFGKSGTDMLPMLTEGSAGLETMKEKARELGLVMSTEAAMKADAVGDAMDSLKAQMGGVAITIGAALAPAILNIANGLSALVSLVMESKGALTGLAVIFGGALIAGIVLFVSTIGLVPLAVGAAIVGIGAAIGLIVENFDFLRDKWESMWESMKGPLTGFAKFMKPVISAIIEFILAIPNAIILAINKLASVVPGVRSVLDNVGIKGDIPKMQEMIGDLFESVVDLAPNAAAAVSGSVRSLLTMPDLGLLKPKAGTFGGAGDAESVAKKTSDVMLHIAKVNNAALAAAYMEGGLQQSNIVRASQETMMAAVNVAAAKMVIDLGITLPEATQIMFDKMQGQQVELAKALDTIANQNMLEQVEVYMKGGAKAVDATRESQKILLDEAMKVATQLAQTYGVDIADVIGSVLGSLKQQAVDLKAATDAARRSAFDLTKQLWDQARGSGTSIDPKTAMNLARASEQATNMEAIVKGLLNQGLSPEGATGAVNAAAARGTLKDLAFMAGVTIINFNGLVGDPVEAGRQVITSINAATRHDGAGIAAGAVAE